MRLPEYKGYIVDFRQRQFRSQPPDHGVIEFVEFESEKGAALLAEMSAKNQLPAEHVPVSTPVLRSTGVRIRIENPIYEDGFEYRRGLGRKGIIRDPKTGSRYELTGKACCFPNCQCDAWAVEIGN